MSLRKLLFLVNVSFIVAILTLYLPFALTLVTPFVFMHRFEFGFLALFILLCTFTGLIYFVSKEIKEIKKLCENVLSSFFITVFFTFGLTAIIYALRIIYFVYGYDVGVIVTHLFILLSLIGLLVISCVIRFKYYKTRTDLDNSSLSKLMRRDDALLYVCVYFLISFMSMSIRFFTISSRSYITLLLTYIVLLVGIVSLFIIKTKFSFKLPIIKVRKTQICADVIFLIIAILFLVYFILTLFKILPLAFSSETMSPELIEDHRETFVDMIMFIVFVPYITYLAISHISLWKHRRKIKQINNL